MAIRLQVRAKGFKALRRRNRQRIDRAGKVGRFIYETSDRISVVHHHGGRQKVDRPMQRAIARKTGATPPKVGKVLVHPRRPVRVTPRMAKRAADDLAKFINRGGRHEVRQIMLEEIVAQFAAGGQPSWKPARSWGRAAAANPTLGGSGRAPLAGWRQRGRYREAK